MRNHRCCFTGHRPNKLNMNEAEIKSLLEVAIDKAIARGFVSFITGMAMGTDIWAAEIVLEKRKYNKNLHLICALPHKGFDIRRSPDEQARFNSIIENADLVRLVSEKYYNGCYQARNQWMVDRTSLVIAVFNGQKSGTKNTIDYANSVGVRVWNLLK